MKQTNTHEEMIRYGDPLIAGRRRKRGYPAINYNDRSPEVEAMNAHLRASAYSETARSSQPTANHLDGAAAMPMRSRSFRNLLRDYDNQARDNFAKEAVFFTVIVSFGLLWPIVHIVRTLY